MMENAMLPFILIGLIIAFSLLVFKKKNWHPILRIILLITLFVSLLLVSYLVHDGQFLGDVAWYNTSPYREIGFFIVMLIGMFASSMNRAFKNRKKTIEDLKKLGEPFEVPKMKMDLFEFFYPFLFSLITFSALMAKIGSQLMTLITISLAFQTGFFWQTLIKDN